MKIKIIAGTKYGNGPYKHVDLLEMVGKTIQAVGTTFVDGAYGDEHGTKHGFVHPCDNWRE